MPTYDIPDGGCGCCGDIVSTCSVPESDWTGVWPVLPAIWVIDPVTGMTDGDCVDGGGMESCCTWFGTADSLGARTLEYEQDIPDSCCWQGSTDTGNCTCDGATGGYVVTMCYDVAADLWTTAFGVDAAIYTLAGASWDPSGTNVMNLLSGGVGECNDWPATITLSPG